MADDKKEPSASYGEPDKNEARDKKNPGTSESSAPTAKRANRDHEAARKE